MGGRRDGWVGGRRDGFQGWAPGAHSRRPARTAGARRAQQAHCSRSPVAQTIATQRAEARGKKLACAKKTFALRMIKLLLTDDSKR